MVSHEVTVILSTLVCGGLALVLGMLLWIAIRR